MDVPRHHIGGPDRIRTYDARFRKPSLYPLSYGAMHSRIHTIPEKPLR